MSGLYVEANLVSLITREYLSLASNARWILNTSSFSNQGFKFLIIPRIEIRSCNLVLICQHMLSLITYWGNGLVSVIFMSPQEVVICMYYLSSEIYLTRQQLPDVSMDQTPPRPAQATGPEVFKISPGRSGAGKKGANLFTQRLFTFSNQLDPNWVLNLIMCHASQ